MYTHVHIEKPRKFRKLNFKKGGWKGPQMVATLDLERRWSLWTAISRHTFQLPPGGGWWWSRPNQTQIAKICPNLHFQRGRGVQPNSNLQNLQICIFFQTNLNPKCLDLSKSAFMGVGGPGQLKPKVPRSVQICIYGGSGEGEGEVVVVQTNSNPKCQDLSKSAFLGVGGGGPGQLKPKLPRSVQICIFGFSGGRWWWSRPTQTQIAKICPNMYLGGGPCQLKPKVPRSVKMCIFRVEVGWGVIQVNLNPKCQDLSKSAFGGGQGGGGSGPGQLEPKVPRSDQICILEGEGRGGGSDQHSWNTWVGALKEFETKILATAMCSASHIVFHTLCVLRLIISECL